MKVTYPGFNSGVLTNICKKLIHSYFGKTNNIVSCFAIVKTLQYSTVMQTHSPFPFTDKVSYDSVCIGGV